MKEIENDIAEQIKVEGERVRRWQGAAAHMRTLHKLRRPWNKEELLQRTQSMRTESSNDASPQTDTPSEISFIQKPNRASRVTKNVKCSNQTRISAPLGTDISRFLAREEPDHTTLAH